ncbi:hypothetical protein LJC26_08035 [Desulfovibrio sp. OttesenSCG-928-O18]|nr:hypothetical protein [Desulfovibrio sp. OttesenSCG-928-O18]
MPEATTETKKGPLSPSFWLMTAILVTAVSVALFVGIFYADSTDKMDAWQQALPTRHMNTEEAEAALVRAKFLHESQVRPQLILAGFISDDDVQRAKNRYSSYDSEQAKSASLTVALWTMRALPELREAMLRDLLDTTRSPENRVADFYTYAAILDNAAANLVTQKDSRRDDFRAYRSDRYPNGGEIAGWFAYFANDPRLNLRPADDRRYRARESRVQEKTADDKALYELNLALARRTLPMVLENVRREMRAQDDIARKETEESKNGKPRSRAAYEGSSREHYLDELSRAANEALFAMGKQRGDSAFPALADSVMNAEEGTFIERCAAVSLIAKKPGLPAAEYVFWGKYKDDLNSITRCVGTDPKHYAFLIGCCDELGVATKKMMKARGSFMLGSHDGPGMSMTRTGTFRPEQNLVGSLYLLADMDSALKDAPDYDLARAYPIFRGMLFRHMERQPLVLPLNAKSESDRKVIDWYAVEGWKTGRVLLFSATGSPADIARQWGSVHLLWWPDKKKGPEAEPDLAYLHPESGHFMLSMVPNLKGKDVSRFFGTITGLWFGRQTVDDAGWVEEKYEARPLAAPTLPARTEPIRSPLWNWFKGTPASDEKPVYSEAAATIVLDKNLRKATAETFGHNYRITLARKLEASLPAPSASVKNDAVTPKDLVAFVNSTLQDLKKWELEGDTSLAQGVEYLWRFRNDPEAVTLIRDILAEKRLRPFERMRKVRRALGLPEQKKGGC